MIRSLSLRAQIMTAFSIIAIITAIVGITGYFGMKKLDQKFVVVTESAPLIQAATQMKLVISQDLMTVMKLMAALDTDELKETWTAHETYANQFNQLQNAILNGAKLDSGIIFPAEDESLRNIVVQTGEYHLNKFIPSFKIIFDQMNRQLSAEPYDYALLDTIDETTIEIGNELNVELEKVVEIARTVINSAETQAHETKALMATIALIATILGICSAVFLGYIFSGIISRRITKAANFTMTVADGDFTQSLVINSNDEIGMMGSAMNKMVDSLAGIFRDVRDGVVTLNDTSLQLSEISNDLEKKAHGMSNGAYAVSNSYEKMDRRLSSVASLSESSSSNLDTVSAAMEEMNAAANEISKNTGNAREITETAVKKARAASVKINELGSEAKEIGQVTQVIAEISDQTNLLALNATIEAARAGEAGKGFAVVANEIKDLAHQTAEAASSIKTKIEQVQNSTKGTVLEIEEISGVINDVNEIVSSIAGAIEEQSISFNEIAQNINSVAEGIHETNSHIGESSIDSEKIVHDISSINENSTFVAKSSQKVAESISELSDFAKNLNDMLAKFKI